MNDYIYRLVVLGLIFFLNQSKVSSQPFTTWYNSDHIPWPSAMSGGFVAPQFSSFDLDRDGRTELISFDRFSGIIQVWVWDEVRTSYQLTNDLPIDWPQIQSWMLVRDYNNDLIPDLFSQGLNGIAVYKGFLDGSIIRFEKLEGESFIDDSLIFRSKSGSTTNIYHAASDIPIIEDVDQDGDLDIMTFELSGSYLYYYKNEWNSSGNYLDFSLKHNCWGYFAEDQTSEKINLGNNQLSCPPPYSVRHTGSSSCLLDVNFDSKPDLLIGDVGSKSMKVMINNAGVDTGFIDQILPFFPDQESAAVVNYFPAAYKIDMNQDSIEDFVITVNDFPLTDNEGIWAYAGISDTNQSFELKTKHWLRDEHIDLGHYSAPYFLNVNGDGMKDLLISYQITESIHNSLNKIAYFKALSPTEFQLRSLDFGSLSNKLTSGYRPYITAGDVDGDGDNDLLVGMSNGTCFLVRNGTGDINRFEAEETEQDWAGLRLLYDATPELYDIDGDGDLDVIAGSDNGTIGLFTNTGNKVEARFNSDLTQFPNIDNIGNIKTIGQNSLLGRSAPRIIHYEGDTILLTGSNQGKLYTYRVNTRDLSSEFEQVELDGWPRWAGGSARVALETNAEGNSRFIAGNVGGGLIEFQVPMVMTNNSDPVNYNFELYPNPVPQGQSLNLSIDQLYKFKKINIIYPTGKIFRSVKASGITQSLSTLDWMSGLYFVQVILDDNRSIVYKVIVE